MRTKLLTTLMLVLLGAVLLGSPVFADSTNPGAFRAPEVYRGAVTTSAYWTAGTINNGGDSLTITAGSAALTTNMNDCAAPTFSACNFVYANNTGTVAVTTTLATATAAGNTLLAMIETGAADAIFTNVVLPQQSGTLWLQAAGPNLAAVVGDISPSAAGGGSLGTALLPFSDVYIGDAATNNFRITGTAAAARTLTLPDVASDTFVFLNAAQTLTQKTMTSPVLNTPTVGTSITPAAAGGSTSGSNALPWSSVYIGDAATNNIQITGTSAAARVMTIPDVASDTFTLVDAAQTLTQKTLTSPVLNTATVGTSIVAATPGADTVGSATAPFSSVYVGDSGTDSFQITGNPTGGQVITIPDATDTVVLVAEAQTLTTKTLTSPAITTDLHSTVAATSTVGTAALPFASVIIGSAATDVFTITPAALAAAVAVTLPDPGGAATVAYTNSTNAQVLTNNTYVSSADADPADAGAIRLGNAEIIGWERNPTGADLTLTADANNYLVWGGDMATDGYYVVPPSNCTMELTVGTFAANPATSGALTAPNMVRTAAGNTVLQLTTTGAANTTYVTCDFTPPSRLLAGAGIIINDVTYTFGYQTTALTGIGVWAPNSVTYPAVGGNPNTTTVAAIGGALTVTAGTDHGAPGAVTAAGELYVENVAFGTPYNVVTDRVRLTWENSFVQAGAAATVMQIGPTFVHYTNARP